MAYPEGRGRGFTPPLNLQNFFELCVCKIYCPSSAPVLIKSYILYRKTLKLYANVKFCFSFWGTLSLDPGSPQTSWHGSHHPREAPSTVKSWVRQWRAPSQSMLTVSSACRLYVSTGKAVVGGVLSSADRGQHDVGTLGDWAVATTSSVLSTVTSSGLPLKRSGQAYTWYAGMLNTVTANASTTSERETCTAITSTLETHLVTCVFLYSKITRLGLAMFWNLGGGSSLPQSPSFSPPHSLPYPSPGCVQNTDSGFHEFQWHPRT